MSVRVRVENLPTSFSRDDLLERFQRYGEVTKDDFRSDYAYIYYQTIEAATDAVQNLNGQVIDGNAISVEISNPMENSALR